MKQTKIAFTYYWTLDERDEDMCIIRIYCLDKNNKNIVLIIDNFTPYIYLELPTQNLHGNINWTTTKAQNLIDQINENVGYCKPLKSNFIYKKKLYYCNYDYSTKKEKVFPYLLLTFQSKKHMKSFKYIAERQYYVPGFGKVRGKVHEMDASPILQFVCHRKITTAGWIKFKGKPVHPDSMITLCDEEYKVNWKDVVYEGGDILPNPLILSMDIEVNSTNPNRMPRPEIPGDKVFQISCILNREGEKDYRKYILTLGDPDQKITGQDVKIIKFKTESDLLLGYSKFIREHRPNIVTGYNILGFDMEYMIERAKFNLILSQFDVCGFPKYLHAEQRVIKWSSSAYKNQEFQFLDGEGILYVDLLPLIKRDFKFNNYKLKTVSEFFIGETKDPLTAKDIFQCYRMGMKNDEDGKKALGCVSKYCVQDSLLVTKLFDILRTWVGLSEMAKVCNVPIFYLYTQGQQIKVYSQVYKKCMYENRVVEKDGYIPNENEKYQGAYVFQPEPGLYDIVVPFDFSSLYPTTIIAYNIDYSTLVPEDSDIPDSKCHVIEWEDDNDSSIHHRYRFVKHPQGVVPNLLQNLLEARKKTKKVMKDKKAELKKLTSKDTKKKYELEQLINILDKRQLAFKVSCNSMYGAMGVKRGYLPFMPGAMCTTAQGRKSLIHASENLQATHNAHLVYGDSVTGDTPVLVRNGDFIGYVNIEDITKEFVTYRETKEFHEPKNLEVWSDLGWTKIKKVIRHKTQKKLYEVLTHTGVVTVTEDHSLLRPDGTELTANDIKVGETKLMIKKLPTLPEKDYYINNNLVTPQVAYSLGAFYADGSCGEYNCKSGLKRTWAINKKNVEFLNNCIDSISSFFPNVTFKILDTMESSHVYKLVAQGNVKTIVASFRKEFYNKDKFKTVPQGILSAPFEVRKSFFEGYYDGDGDKDTNGYCRFDTKGKIGAAGLYLLVSSLGYSASVNMRKDKRNIYRITCTKNNQRKSPDIVKKILPIDISEDTYVYDFETENHHFSAGIGQLVVHNTDLIWVGTGGVKSVLPPSLYIEEARHLVAGTPLEH